MFSSLSATPKPILTPAQAAQSRVDRGLVPRCGYNWLPFLKALFERGKFTEETKNAISSYEIYVPEWTRPDFVDGRELVLPDWEFLHRPVPNAHRSLRPALLPVDAAQDPTDYAIRWGIYPGRADGRSRLEPTNHNSRIDNGLQREETALADQEWQRFIFHGLTTDEVIQENVHTMSNAATHKLDMTQPLHALLVRNKWDDPATRASTYNEPRYGYRNRDGQREWNARQNGDVWAALQPALQFATRVLNQDPAIWQAIKDFRTRRPINPGLDDRPVPRTRCLWKMVPVDDIDTLWSPEPAVKLHQERFDSSARIDQILDAGLSFRIVDSHNFPPRNLRNEQANKFDRTWDSANSGFYGLTEANANAPGQFVISLSAQMLWPLLVPDYSSSEKLCCHFMIAVTILHELMHATHYASAFMCGVIGKQHPPGQTARVSELLEQLGAQVFDMTHADGEPYWKNDVWAELGSAFEYEIFGMLTCALPVPGSVSKMITLNPLLLEGYSYPAAFCETSRFLAADRPIVDFSQPIRVDWIVSRFDQDWWDEQVTMHGLETIGRMTNPAHAYYTLMSHDWADEESLRKIMGEDDYNFSKTVWTLLDRRGMTILADHCKDQIWSVHVLFGIKSRLQAEYKQRVAHNFWGLQVDPLPDALEDLQTAGWLGTRVLECWSNPNHEDGFRDWKENVPGQGNACRFLDVGAWRTKMTKYVVEYFSENGVTLQRIAKVHHIYVRELGKLERYIHEYLRQEHPKNRYYLWPADDSSKEFDWVFLTLGAYAKTASTIRDLVNSIGEHVAFEGTEVPLWMERWTVIFDQFFHRADLLYRGLLADQKQELGQADIQRLLANIKAPSSIRLNRKRQFQGLARHEYNLASQAIRDTVDEFVRRAAAFEEKLRDDFDLGSSKIISRLRGIDMGREAQTPAPHTRIANINKLMGNLINAYTPSAQPGTPSRVTGERPPASSIAKTLSVTSRLGISNSPPRYGVSSFRARLKAANARPST